GYREADEVRAAIDTIARRSDVDPARFGLWGYNLGAYAALREAEKDPRVRAIVLDSADDPELSSISRDMFLKASEPREQQVIAHGNFVNLPDDEKRTYENRVVTFFLARLPTSNGEPVPVWPAAPKAVAPKSAPVLPTAH